MTSFANDEWPRFTRPQSTGFQAWKQCWSFITSCNRSQNQFLSLKMHSSWFAGVSLSGESYRQQCEWLPQATADMCVSQRCTFYSHDIYLLLYLIKYHFTWLVFKKKNHEVRTFIFFNRQDIDCMIWFFVYCLVLLFLFFFFIVYSCTIS